MTSSSTALATRQFGFELSWCPRRWGPKETRRLELPRSTLRLSSEASVQAGPEIRFYRACGLLYKELRVKGVKFRV